MNTSVFFCIDCQSVLAVNEPEWTCECENCGTVNKYDEAIEGRFSKSDAELMRGEG